MNNARLEYLESLKNRLKKKRLIALKHAFARGMQAGQEDCEALNNALNKNLMRAHELKISCVISCAQKLVAEHLENNPRDIVGMAQRVLKNIADHSDAELLVHPQDAAILEISTGNSSRRGISICKDETLERGSIVVKAHKSIIDAQISTQLSQARDLLMA